MNSLVYRTLFYVNIYGSYKLSKKKQSSFLAHPVFETEQLHTGNWVKTRQNCPILSTIVFTPLTCLVRVGGVNEL